MKFAPHIVALSIATLVGAACASPGGAGTGVGPLPDLGDFGGADVTGDSAADTGSELPGPDAPVFDAPTGDAPGQDTPLGDVTAPDVPAADVPVADTPVPDITPDSPADAPAEVPVADVAVDTPAEGETTSGTITIPTLQQAQDTTACDSASIVGGQAVTMSGLVVTSPVHQVSATLEAVYVADPGGANLWGGLFVTAPLGVLDGVTQGLTIDVTGQVQEYYCNTQVAAQTVQISGSGTVPTPVTLTAPSEPYEGMLVTVDNVTVLSAVAGGLWDVGNGFLVENDFGIFLSLTVGESYTVTGQLKYSFDEWRVVPRTPADVVFNGTIEQVLITTLQQSDASVNCTTADNLTIAAGLVVEGTISVGQWDLSSSLHGYHLTSGGGAYESIALNVPKTLASALVPGDRVRVTGDHIEFFCMTQFSASALELLSKEAGPAPITVSVAELESNAEAWEGALISVTGLQAGSSPNFSQFGDVDTTTVVGGEALLIDDAIVGAGAYGAPAVGASITVTGAFRYAFGAYRITPRDLGDISW